MIITVRPIKPGKMDLRAIDAEVMKVLQAEGKRDVVDFQRTTRTWKNKPKFAYIARIRGMKDAVVRSGLASWVHGSAVVGKEQEVWAMLNQGTRRHPIIARRAKLLRFRKGYRAKTTPRKMSSRSGGAKGDFVYAKQVMHPGTQAREWTETEYKRRIKPFTRNVNAAVERATKKMYK